MRAWIVHCMEETGSKCSGLSYLAFSLLLPPLSLHLSPLWLSLLSSSSLPSPSSLLPPLPLSQPLEEEDRRRTKKARRTSSTHERKKPKPSSSKRSTAKRKKKEDRGSKIKKKDIGECIQCTCTRAFVQFC